MQIRIIDEFQAIPGENRSQVFELIPSQFGDERGKFCEVLKKQVFEKTNDTTDWVFGMEWIKQVNRSESIPGVVRGMHAQKGSNCQGKLVSCVSGVVYDIIVDARPNSKTYGKTKAFRLDSASYNMLWVRAGSCMVSACRSIRKKPYSNICATMSTTSNLNFQYVRLK